MKSSNSDMKKLWNNYLFVTQELGKFTQPEDVDLCLDLLHQREQIMATIKQTPDDENYISSVDGQQLIKQIAQLDKDVYDKMSASKNMLKKKFELSSAYEGYAPDAVAVGGMFDSKNN